MKKSLILTTLMASLALTAPLAMAHHTPEHTAQQSRALAKDVKNAKQRADGAPVQLKGYLVKKIGDEQYTFKDRTGTMTVEIDDDLMKGRKVDAKKVVSLTGEVDVEETKDHRYVTKIDVKTVR